MLRIILVEPGATEFDEQRRIKGNLDIPLSDNGLRQVAAMAVQLSEWELDVIYTSPCRSSVQTAEAIAFTRSFKVKTLDKLKNVDHGLWQGKLISEVKQNQPKVYRQCQEHPERVCPPEGEALADAHRRVEAAMGKLLKKHRSGLIAIVAPQPLSSILRSQLRHEPLGDLWNAECDAGKWEVIEIKTEKAALS